MPSPLTLKYLKCPIGPAIGEKRHPTPPKKQPEARKRRREARRRPIPELDGLESRPRVRPRPDEARARHVAGGFEDEVAGEGDGRYLEGQLGCGGGDGGAVE
jgi:hypothetical protein